MMTAVFQSVVSSTGIDIEKEVDLAKRKALRADKYLLNRMSKTVVREQVPPGTETGSASFSGVVPVLVPAAKARPIAVPGVKAFAKSKSHTVPVITVQSERAKSCPTTKSSNQ